MKVTKTTIPDLLILEPKVFTDERGFFIESFNKKKFENAIGYTVDFVQDNHSKSKKNVLRGLHFQLAPNAQGKLVRVVKGSVFDVAVDLRKSSKHFLKWFGLELSEDNQKQLWIPEGFAHGFLTLTDNTELLYKTTDYYSPELERTISWNNSKLDILWPIKKNCVKDIIVSSKDQHATYHI